jgi:hypothetical protein
MTNIGHFRAAAKLLEGKRDIPVKLWVAPPTKMDAAELTKEGHYGTFGAAGARTEMPGCSLCMGNQAQVREGDGDVHLDPQLPEPSGQEHQCVSGFRRTGRDLLEAGAHPDRGRIPRRHGRHQQGWRQDVPLHELRPDRRVCGDREGADHAGADLAVTTLEGADNRVSRRPISAD